MNVRLRQFALLAAFIFALATRASAEGTPDSIVVSISPRVIGDTSNEHIREVVALWTSYLNSIGDSAYKKHPNPFWSAREQQEFHPFDLAGLMLYANSGVPTFCREFKPLVLSVDSIPEGYLIRTAFITQDTDYFYESLFGMEDVLAKREFGHWRLFNAFPYEANQLCEKKQIANFTLYYTRGHHFNERLANRTVTFVDSLAKMFSLPVREHYEYYIADNIDEITAVMGMPFCLSMSTGITRPEDGRIFTASGLEFYPHELTHLVMGACGSQFASEGIATWQGGFNYHEGSLWQSVQDVKRDLEKANAWPLDSVIAHEWHFRSANLFYVVGGMVASLLYKTDGVKGILQFRAAKQSEVIPTIQSLLKQSNLTVGTIWKRYLLSTYKSTKE